MLNVADFGAVGDGVTYNDTAFASALAAAASTGDTLWVPPGTYLLAKQLQGPTSGVSAVASSVIPTVTSIASDTRFYEVEIQTVSGGGGTLKYKSHPLKGYDATGVSFTFGIALTLGSNPAAITVPAGATVGAKFQWRGGGVRTFPTISTKPITLQGAGRTSTVLNFDFSGSGGVGDGVCPAWSTYSNGGSPWRIADLTMRNSSSANKCGLSTPIDSGGGAPSGFAASGSPTGALDRYRVEILSTGVLGTATFRATRNNGAASPIYPAAQLVPASGVTQIPGTGVTLTFPSASFTAGNFWEFEAIGYGGAAIMCVGAVECEFERLFLEGWKVGICLDATNNVRITDCIVKDGTLTAASHQTVGVFIASANLYSRVSVEATNILKLSGGALACRFGVLDWGGVVHEFGPGTNMTGSVTAFFFSAGNAFSIREVYLEGLALAFAETDWTGSIYGLSFGHCYINNTYKKPILINRLALVNLAFENVFVTGNPDGTTGVPEYGIAAAENNALVRSAGSLLQTAAIENSTLPFGGGVLFSTDPSLGTRYMGSDAGQWARHGFNVAGGNAQANLHVRRVDTLVPLFVADRAAGSGVIPRFAVDNDAQGIVLSTGKAATGGGERGRITRVLRATTSSGATSVTVLDYVIPQLQAVDVRVTCHAVCVSSDKHGVWRQSASFRNFAGTTHAAQTGSTYTEGGYPRTTTGLALAAPVVTVNSGATGFAIKVNQGTETEVFQWTITAEIDQAGDGGVV